MEGTYDWGGTDDGACISTQALGGSGACSPRKSRCSDIASEAIFVLKLIFGLDAARIQGQAFMERCSLCSGIVEPSLHTFQRRGMVKKVTIPDSWKGWGH